MQYVFVRYDPATGDIKGSGRAYSVKAREGLELGQVLDKFPFEISPDKYRVDLKRVALTDDIMPLVFLVEKSEEEQYAARLPSTNKVRVARDLELRGTDEYMLEWPPDRPGAPDTEAWGAYRQQLRDLGGYETAEEMIANAPVRPDGVDAFVHWRELVTP